MNIMLHTYNLEHVVEGAPFILMLVVVLISGRPVFV